MIQPIPTPNLFWKTGGGPAPFKPSDLGSVLAEFDASVLSSLDLSDNVVNSWTSLDGNTVLIPIGDDPDIFIPGFFGANACIEFDGDSGLSAEISWTPAAVTWFIVAHAQAAQSGGANRFFSMALVPGFDYASITSFTVITDATGDDLGMYFNGTQQFDLTTGNQQFAGGGRIAANGSITGWQQNLGGTLQTATASALPPAFAPTNLFVGTNSEPMPLFGQIAYIIIYSRALTDPEAAQVMNYLNTRFQ